MLLQSLTFNLTTALTESGVTNVSLTKSKLITHSLAYNNKIKVLHDSLLYAAEAAPAAAWDPG